MQDYQHKPSDYYRHARMDVLRCLGSVQGQRILELGAGGGYTLAEAKSNGGASYVAGVEWMKLPETAQNSPLMDEFHHADLMKDTVELRQQNYDVLLCLDILEHLTDPWQTLQTWSKHLVPGGKLLISLPNIREISVLWKIAIHGDFAYSADGILDRTHLRFFARRNAASLPDSSQYEDVRVHAAMTYQQGLVPQGPRFRPVLNQLMFGWPEDFLTHQWFVTAVRKDYPPSNFLHG